MSFSLVKNIILSTPSVSSATGAVTALAAIFTAANRVAARTVETTSEIGIADWVASAESMAKGSQAAGARPRRVSRARNRYRPRASRL